MKLFAPILIGSILALAGVAYAGEKRSNDDNYVIETVGDAKSCINRSQIRSTNVIDDQTIDFEMNNGDIYRNELPNKCSGLGFEKAFSYSPSNNQLCSVDIIHVLSSSAGRLDTRAACGLGKFQKITKTKLEKTSK
ncbi:MAG: hypothetical protein V7676_15870 [Parasphingorhabdus sp.]|uniref:hypothetical protein n=1 Tax=Parasphingorhabdus sp. TaxID=2709688 RepID=UPI00300205A8